MCSADGTFRKRSFRRSTSSSGVRRRARRSGVRRRARADAHDVRRSPVGAERRAALLGARRRARLAQARRPESHRRAQDQQHRGAGAAGAAHGKAADHRRNGRRPARRRDGDRVRAVRSRVRRVHGRGRHAAPVAQRLPHAAHGREGRRRLERNAHAEGRDDRGDSRLGDERQRHATTSSVRSSGPAPYPRMVRDFQSIIGREARAQMLERAGRLPKTVVACVGGGSNAMGAFHALRRRSRGRADRRRGGRRRTRDGASLGVAVARTSGRAARRR